MLRCDDDKAGFGYTTYKRCWIAWFAWGVGGESSAMAVSPLINHPGTVIPSPSSKDPYPVCNLSIPRLLPSPQFNAKPKQWIVRAAQDTKETNPSQSAEEVTQKYGLEAGLWKVITHPWQVFRVICVINISMVIIFCRLHTDI